MIPPELSLVFFSLLAAFTWGAADFGGGVATKRASVYSVVILMQGIGLLFLPLLAIFFSEELVLGNGLIWGLVAGVAGSLGLIALYTALSQGKMGVVAPISAIVTVALPVVYSSFNEGLPDHYKIIGFVVAMLSMWLIGATDQSNEAQKRDVILAFIAGFGFGMFFISVDMFSETAVYWPLSVAKLSAVVVILAFALFKKKAEIPSMDVMPVIIIAGIFDAGGNLFFALASQAGRLDIATVLASLYPGSTVLLAWLFLKEKLSKNQWLGVAFALMSIVLISL